MLKTYLYIPDQLDLQIKRVAREENKSKAMVIREALQEGLKSKGRAKGGAEVLLELSKMAKKLHIKGPRDLSVNHDYYLWGGEKKDKRFK